MSSTHGDLHTVGTRSLKLGTIRNQEEAAGADEGRGKGLLSLISLVGQIPAASLLALVLSRAYREYHLPFELHTHIPPILAFDLKGAVNKGRTLKRKRQRLFTISQ